MAKQNGGKPQIDEDFMKEIISQGLPVKKQETQLVAETKVEVPNIPATGRPDRPPAVVRQPYHPRKTNEDSNRDRRTQSNCKQLCRKHPAPAFRPVSGRDQRTVRKQI